MSEQNCGRTGWNTWASSPPKDHLAKYVAQAGPDQIVLIDNVMPPAFQGRTPETQGRMTDLYTRFLGQLAIATGNQLQTIRLSDCLTLEEAWQCMANYTLSDLRQTMPRDKRKFPNLALSELLHSIGEYVAFNQLRKLGATRILRGSGQTGLMNKCADKTLEFEPVDAAQPLNDHLRAHLQTDKKNSVDDTLKLWSEARMIKGRTHMDNYHSFLDRVKGPDKRKVIERLQKHFKEVKGSACMVVGKTAQTDCGASGDLDMLVISQGIDLPDTFPTIPLSIRNAFQQANIPVVSVKSDFHGVETSIRYVNPLLLTRYYQSPVTPYWRQRPLYAHGQTSLDFRSTDGESHSIELDERPYDDGGSLCHNYQVVANGIPLIDATAHMVLTGRFITNTGCYEGIKLDLIRQIKDASPNLPTALSTILSADRPVNADIGREVDALWRIL